jgi:transcriptional regulator with XRE-family HTH domain
MTRKVEAGGSRQPRNAGSIALLKRFRARRERRGLSLREASVEVGYYSASMLWLLEQSLKPWAARKPSMSKRGMEAIRRWLAS